MGASSKTSARLVTSTIVVTLTNPTESATAKEEPTDSGDSSEASSSGFFVVNATSISVSLPSSFPSFSAISGAQSSGTRLTGSSSATQSSFSAPPTLVILPTSTTSSIPRLSEAKAQAHGLSQKDIIIISSSVGGGVLLFLLAGIALCLVRRRNKRKSRARREYHSSYGPPPPDPFNVSLIKGGADMSQDKSSSTHYKESVRYLPEQDNGFYYDAYSNANSSFVGEQQRNQHQQQRTPRREPSRILISPQRSIGRGSTPHMIRSMRLESPVDPEMEERKRLTVRPMREDETPPTSASPLDGGRGFRDGDAGGYDYPYTDDYVPSPPIVHPAISLADATPARTPRQGEGVAGGATPSTANTQNAQHSQQEYASLEGSTSFEYPSWLRMGVSSGAIDPTASSSPVRTGAMPVKNAANRKSAIVLAPLVIPEYVPRARAASVSTSSGRDASRVPARTPEPRTPLPAPPVPPMPNRPAPAPAQVVASSTDASVVTRKSTRGRRSVKRGKATYQALDSPGPGQGGAVEGDRRPESPESDGGDSASLYSQVSASMYSQASASASAHANEHGSSGQLELSDSTILAFPLMMQQNPLPQTQPQPQPHRNPPPRPPRRRSSPSLSPSMSLPNSIFNSSSSTPRGPAHAVDADGEGEGEDSITMRVAGLIQSRVKQMRSVAPPERSGSVVSHIERAGSIKPAFGLGVVEEDGVEYYTEEGGTTRPLRIGAARVAGAKVRMARMKRAAAAMDQDAVRAAPQPPPPRPLQDGTNVK